MEGQVRRGELFRLALGFLTIFPVGEVQGSLSQASFFFPLVGLFLGLLSLLWWELLLFLTQSPLFSAFCTVFLGVFLTRGLHLDGLADVCDAWVVEKGRQLEVLKDSRLGTFGVLGVVFALGMKVLLLSEIRNPWYILLTPFFGRIGVLELGLFFPPLFPDRGLGKELLGRVPLGFFLFWVGLSALGMGWWQGAGHLLKIGIHFGIIYTLGKWCTERFGGLNGDMLGAGVELGEMLTLLFGWFWP
ncbi:MAG: adenosylcobinamide-GDP ribazoletransferase [Candidatus Caldatribacteriaceae bacterium]